MAVYKARLLEPLERSSIKITPSGLVIGGGLSGMTAALELRNQGFNAYLVEREAELGGHLKHLYYTFKENDIQNYLDSLKEKISKDNGLKVYTNARIKEISGNVGRFTTTLIQDGTEEKLEHGIIIVATGGKEYKPSEYL